LTSGTPQLIITVLLIIAVVVLILTGHNNDTGTQALTAILGVAAGFFFRDAMSKINSSTGPDNRL
jgi:hypothetical protein